MFLYDKKENSLDVYSFEADKQTIIDYRMEQMLKIPERERVVVAQHISRDVRDTPLFEAYNNELDNTILPIEMVDATQTKESYQILLKGGVTSRRNREILLDSYYYGHLTDRPVARVQDLDRLRYFLLSKTTYSRELHDNRMKKLKDIIELPESLYILQMLGQEKFHLIGGLDISEQLDLFSISHIDEIDLRELKKMDTCGITQNASEKVLSKADNDAHILKLIRKKQ